MAFFDRVCKIIIGTEEEQAIEVDEKFRLTFDITLNSVGANQATIQIYNLNRDRRQRVKGIIKENEALIKKGEPPLKAFVFAGYKEGNGLEFLFSGQITRTYSLYQMPDIITTINAYGNVVNFRDELISVTYAAGVNIQSIIRQIAGVLKMDIDAASNFTGANINFANGVSLSGRAKDALDKIASLAGLRWSVQNNKLKFSPIGNPTTDDRLLLSPETGVINPPKELDNQGFQILDLSPMSGWEVDSLLQPKAFPLRTVRVETKEINGDFMVDSVEHKGDTRATDWISILNVREFSVI